MKTKLLRNIGIYYIIFTGVSVVLSFYFVLYLFIPLLPILLLGIIFIIIHSVTNNESSIVCKLTRFQFYISTFLLIILPIIFYLFTVWYVFRPYKQVIVIPENYEGIVVIQYDKPNGQPKKWTGGFFGIDDYRLIEVDSTGIAESQFDFHHNSIPFLGLEQTYYNRGGLKIFFENDLKNEIITGANGINSTYENKDKNKPSIYFTDAKMFPLIIFVITKKDNYSFYFMNEDEKNEWNKIDQKKSSFYIDPTTHRLKEEINNNLKENHIINFSL